MFVLVFGAREVEEKLKLTLKRKRKKKVKGLCSLRSPLPSFLSQKRKAWPGIKKLAGSVERNGPALMVTA